MSGLDFILKQFHKDLERAGHLLNLITEFRKFAGSDVPIDVESGRVAWPEAVKLAGIAPRVRTDLPVLSGSILLYICGRFEYFVREVVVFLADEMVTKVESFKDLPDRLKSELRSKTLEISQNPARYGYSHGEAEQLIISLARNLETSGVSSGAVSISSRVLSVTESNMNPRTLAEVLKRVDIRDVWTEIGKQAPLKAHLSKGSDRECSSEAQVRLEAMMKERNGVAHPTDATSFPGPGQVIEYSDFLKVLSRVIVDIALVPRVSEGA